MDLPPKSSATGQSSTMHPTHKEGINKTPQSNSTTSPHIPRQSQGAPPHSQQRLLEKINQTHTTSPVQIVADTAALNSLLLAEGVTGDARLVHIQRSGTPLPSLNKNTPKDIIEEDDEFFDALEQLPDLEKLPNIKEDVEGEDDEFFDVPEWKPTSSLASTVDESKEPILEEPAEKQTQPSYISRIFNRAKELTGAPALYRTILNKASSTLASKFIKGIDGPDINQLLVSMNEVHTQKEPQTIHLKTLTFPKLDPSYNLTNAAVTIHEVSTPDPIKGYKKIQLKISISADITYPTSEGSVNGHVHINEALIDLDFEHEQVIQRLLTSANVVTTGAQILGSLAYSKLPSVPGWKRIKDWAGWSQQSKEQIALPSLKSLLSPTAIKLSHADIHAEVKCKDQPEVHAQFDIKSDALSYDFTEEPGHLTCTNTQLSFNGEQSEKLIPFQLKEEVAQVFPYFRYDHSSFAITVPDLILKNEKDNRVVVIPEASIKVEGDITLHGGRAEDIRMGLFKQPTGSTIVAVKAKSLSAEHVLLPGGSLKLPFTEEGRLSAKDANLTFIHSTENADTSASELVKQEGASLYQRLKGWVGLDSTPDTQLETHQDGKEEKKTNSIFTFSTSSCEADIHGGVGFEGGIKKLGLIVDNQTQQFHLDVDHVDARKVVLPNKQSEEMLSVQGTASNFHLVVPPLRKSHESLAVIETGEVNFNVNKPTKVHTTTLESFHLSVQQPSEENFHLRATGKSLHSEGVNITALKGNAQVKIPEFTIDSDMHSRPTTQDEKDAVAKFWQQPQQAITQITLDVKADVIHSELSPEKPVSESNVVLPAVAPIIDTLKTTAAYAHIDISEPKGSEGLDVPKVITGHAGANNIDAQGCPEIKHLSENDQRIVEVCQKISEEMPELVETMAEEHSNVLDAAASGAASGVHLAMNVGAMLLAFTALIALFNGILGWVGGHFGDSSLSMQQLLGYVFAPVAWLLGVPWHEAMSAGSLVGEKIVVNEFMAYASMAKMHGLLSAHSAAIVTFALCGFANLSSIAIQLGLLGSIAPSRRSEVARLGLRAVFAGTLSNLMSASIAGFFLMLHTV